MEFNSYELSLSASISARAIWETCRHVGLYALAGAVIMALVLAANQVATRSH